MNFKDWIRHLGRLYSVRKLDLPAYFLPCSACRHKCAIDASSCPSCGTRKIFPIPSRLRLFFATLLLIGGGCGALALASVIDPLLTRTIILIWGAVATFLGFFTFVMLLFRDSILEFMSKVHYTYPDINPYAD